jgi:hypothetical protein
MIVEDRAEEAGLEIDLRDIVNIAENILKVYIYSFRSPRKCDSFSIQSHNTLNHSSFETPDLRSVISTFGTLALQFIQPSRQH